MGAVGGYAVNIRGAEAEIATGSGFEQNDILSSMGTVGKDWGIASNMAASSIRLAVDAASFNVSRLGVLGSLEGEFYPTDDTMLSGWAIYTPAYRWGYFEARAGVALPFRSLLPASFAENAYIGPHAAFSMTEGAGQPMFGGHLSGLKIGDLHLNYTFGYTRETSGGGVYSILETTLQF